MQRRRLEAEERLRDKRKYRPRRASSWRHLCERCSQSKFMSMVANLVGAIGCILGNKHIMTTHARMPLTLTFLGYGLVILYFVVANRVSDRASRRGGGGGRAPRSGGDVEAGDAGAAAGKRAHAGPSRRQVAYLVLLTATAPSLANARSPACRTYVTPPPFPGRDRVFRRRRCSSTAWASRN